MTNSRTIGQTNSRTFKHQSRLNSELILITSAAGNVVNYNIQDRFRVDTA